MLAYFFVLVLAWDAEVVGPFQTWDGCEQGRTAQEYAAYLDEQAGSDVRTGVSECFALEVDEP
jgi:hypothetical protein